MNKVISPYIQKVFLTDLRLVGMDGLALTRRIKSDPVTRQTLVIALYDYAGLSAKETVRLTETAGLALGHAGPHIDPMNAEQWEAPAGAIPTLLRQEEDPA